MQSQTNGWLLFLILGSVSALFLYQNRQNAVLRKELSNQSAIWEAKTKQLNKELTIFKVQIDTLDTAVQIDSKFKARIKLIRNIVKEDSKRLNQRLDLIDINTIATQITLNSEKYDLAPSIILAIIRQESAYKITAISPAGAQGLMQILPSTAGNIKQWLGKSYYSPFKITDNIQFGSFYFAKLLHDYNFTLSQAIMAYNAGPEATRRYIAGEIKKLPDETINYEIKVLQYIEEYKNLGIK
jgi:soluble lytic murein transglycosylase-like protein